MTLVIDSKHEDSKVFRLDSTAFGTYPNIEIQLCSFESHMDMLLSKPLEIPSEIIGDCTKKDLTTRSRSEERMMYQDEEPRGTFLSMISSMRRRSSRKLR
jgi:hypothetical protein